MTITEMFESAIVSRRTVWKKTGTQISKKAVEVVKAADIDKKSRYEIKKAETDE